MSRFAVGESDFLLDGAPFRVLAGAIHYFRVHPEQWRDRIRAARAMGLNTIETYVAWNAHAPTPDSFDTEGRLDLGRFLDLVAEEGMWAMVRPGPYICAEWGNGGLPAWLFADAGVGIRRLEPTYLAAVREFYGHLAPVLVPRQIDAGGPIILVQVENEYGAYGTDRAYLEAVRDLTREIGIHVPLTTVDQPIDEMQRHGGLPDVLRTASFGSRPAERLAKLRRFQPTGPLMCAEFWDGWFDHWGEHHHTTSAADAAADLDALLAAGASVNIYMFHGGTNFGLTNGANFKGRYSPIVTSYDYDAPLDEAGRPTEKFHAFREVIARYAPVTDPVPSVAEPGRAVEVDWASTAQLSSLLPLLGDEVASVSPPTMDDLGHFAGFVSAEASVDLAGGVLEFDEVRDRAQVFVDGRLAGVVNRDHFERRVVIPASERGQLRVLIEDLGRVNYGERLGEQKGLVGEVRLDGRPVTGWRTRPLDLERLPALAAEIAAGEAGGTLAGPVVARARFDLEDPGVDRFLGTRDLGKGVAWVNGFCLGRYWSRGPQHRLYVPGPVLRARDNELVVLELDSLPARASFSGEPDLGHREV